MADHPAPPPLPSSAYDAPLRVLPLEGPVSLNYNRPRWITAIGAASIVIAALSILASLASAFGGLIWLAQSAVTSQRAAAMRAYQSAATAQRAQIARNAASASASVLTPTDQLLVGERGMTDRERRLVIAGLSSLQPLSQQRQERLHALLAKAGRDIIQLSEENLRPQNVQSNVSASGTIPSARSNVANQEPPVYFIVGTGKIEVYDDHATFFPSDASTNSPIIRVAKGFEELKGGLTRAQIDAFIDAVGKRLNGPLTAPRRAAIERALYAPNQQLLMPPEDPDPQLVPAQLQMVTDANGMLTIETLGGSLMLDTNGNIVGSGGSAPVGTTPVAAANSPSASAVGGIMLDAGASLLLAIYLLTIGILTLRQSSRGRGLHFVYVVLKLLVLALGTLAWAMFFKGATDRTGAAGWNVFLVMWTIGAAIYPLALLVVLNLRSVREYYRTATTVV